LDEEKSKYGGLTQEIGFAHFAVAETRHSSNNAVHLQKHSVKNMI
jgi:hypothetical protein